MHAMQVDCVIFVFSSIYLPSGQLLALPSLRSVKSCADRQLQLVTGQLVLHRLPVEPLGISKRVLLSLARNSLLV